MKLKKRASFGPINLEWYLALFIIIAAIFLYMNLTSKTKVQNIGFNERDADHISSQRFLFELLRTPTLIKGHGVTIAELLAYREVDVQYEPLLTTLLAKYLPTDSALLLMSGSSLVTQYGSLPENDVQPVIAESEAEIPSFRGEPYFLTVVFKTKKVGS